MNTATKATTTDYEQIITLIPGVIATRVAIDNATVAEVHVLCDTTRHPMQLVRDIESSLIARFGIRIDRRRISVAQIDPGMHEHPRLALESINLSLSGNEAEVRAELVFQEKRVTGVARGPATSRGKLVLAAQAVLRAVGELMPGGVSFVYETLDSMQLGGENAVLVLVTLVHGQQTQSLAGAAFVRRDETEAAGRAALAAVNRRLALFLEV